MTDFVFNQKVNSPFADVTDAALGAAASEGWATNDIGKAVKITGANSYALCVNGDPIEGFVVAVEAISVNDGFGFGAVQRNCRVEAELFTGVSGAAVGDFVVSGTQAAVGTAGIAQVKPEAVAGTEDVFNWRIIRLFTDGNAGSKVLLERT